MNYPFISLLLIGICLKCLLIPAYYSTDFDVHHNWLRITNTLPLKQWYFDELSKWTLDYPPFFAYFQYTLSLVAQTINPIINNLTQSQSAFYFQRISVIIWQIPLAYILYLIYDKKISSGLVLAYLFVPFTILDNVHFQYNIMLQCLFLLSFYFLRQSKFLLASITYSVLLNFKHIYLYCSLAFFLVILKYYVFKQNHQKQQLKILKFIKVAIVTLTPFVCSFSPFIAVSGMQGLTQIFKRLFPFGRGLIHQFWAPNFWALYHFFDKVFYFAVTKITPSLNFYAKTQENNGHLNSLKILPEPSANMTLFIILIAMIPLIINFMKKKYLNLSHIIVVSGLCFFFFGYHVHQKAITPYIHLLLITVTSQKYSKSTKETQDQSKKPVKIYSDNKYVFCAIFVNIMNLLPLLIDNKEKPLKLILIIIYVLVWKKLSKLNKIEQYMVIAGMGLIFISELMGFFLFKKLQFLPLMINSVFCGSFNLIWFIYLYYDGLVDHIVGPSYNIQILRDNKQGQQQQSLLQANK